MDRAVNGTAKFTFLFLEVMAGLQSPPRVGSSGVSLPTAPAVWFLPSAAAGRPVISEERGLLHPCQSLQALLHFPAVLPFISCLFKGEPESCGWDRSALFKFSCNLCAQIPEHVWKKILLVSLSPPGQANSYFQLGFWLVNLLLM